MGDNLNLKACLASDNSSDDETSNNGTNTATTTKRKGSIIQKSLGLDGSDYDNVTDKDTQDKEDDDDDSFFDNDDDDDGAMQIKSIAGKLNLEDKF